MANLKNWLPEMTPEEMEWFDKCPKAVLFEIARQFGMRLDDNLTAEGAFDVMRNEWDILHVQGIVPQKPPGKSRARPQNHAPASCQVTRDK